MHKRNSFLALALLCAAIVAGNVDADGQAKAQVCIACHGADGNSVNPIWPNLAGQHPSYIVSQLKAFNTGGRDNPSMPPAIVPDDEKDMQEIAEFFSGQSLRVASIAAADAAAGQKLYRGGDAERGIPACMACHGPDGAGNAAARYPALRGQHAEYTLAQLKAYRDGKRATDPQEMMRMIARKLSDTDMDNLARYLSALH